MNTSSLHRNFRVQREHRCRWHTGQVVSIERWGELHVKTVPHDDWRLGFVPETFASTFRRQPGLKLMRPRNLARYGSIAMTWKNLPWRFITSAKR